LQNFHNFSEKPDFFPDYVLVYEVRKEELDGGSPMDIAKRESFLREMEMLGVETEKVGKCSANPEISCFLEISKK
jgi:hypothetical protein